MGFGCLGLVRFVLMDAFVFGNYADSGTGSQHARRCWNSVYWDVDAEDPDQIVALMPYSIHHSSISGVILLNQSRVKGRSSSEISILKLT